MAHRPWFRYSLRTLFLLVTVFAIYLGWAMNWIHQRRALIENHPNRHCIFSDPVHNSGKAAPWPLRLLGERGFWTIYVEPPLTPEVKDHVKRLFPEVYFVLDDEGPPPPPFVPLASVAAPLLN